MRNPLILLLVIAIMSACTSTIDSGYAEPGSGGDVLYRNPGMIYNLGDDFAYLNQEGDTIIPSGTYAYSFTDTLTHFAIVGDDTELFAINAEGDRLYEVYVYDNGPDYLQEGLFRILRNEKIGYADATGQIMIEPQFACAEPFEDGKARVALDCTLNSDGEHTTMDSDGWFYIDRAGEKVE